MRILVAGAGGQLGQTIVGRLSATNAVVALARADLDLTSEPDVLRLVEAEHPDVIVNHCSDQTAHVVSICNTISIFF